MDEHFMPLLRAPSKCQDILSDKLLTVPPFDAIQSETLPRFLDKPFTCNLDTFPITSYLSQTRSLHYYPQ